MTQKKTEAAIFINSSQDAAERGKARSKRSGLHEEGMAKAMSDEKDRSGEAAAGRIPDEIMKVAAEISFEEAFQRLEEILEKLHSSAISLDESLKFYEEADRLIVMCSKKLTQAEQKIEILQKQRGGELVLGSDQKPSTQPFQP